MQTNNNNSSSSSTPGAQLPLQERLRLRHKQLLDSFDEARLHRTQGNDAAAADRLVALRNELSNHRMGSETAVVNALRENEVAMLNLDKKSGGGAASQRNDTPATTSASTANEKQDDAVPLALPMPADDIHGPSGHLADSYEEVLAQRRERIVAARMRVVQLAHDIRRAHLFRMQRLDDSEQQLYQLEQARQTEIEARVRELVEAIISIAHVGVTQAQAIAQGILVEENERALANHVGLTSLFAKLRQHELLHFRAQMKQLRDVLSKNEERMVRSILVWSVRILAFSDRFRRPPGRFALVAKTRDMVLQAGRNFKHVVGSITAAVESLPRKPRPTAAPVPLHDYFNASLPIPLPESMVPCDIPGGTGDGGWLRHFQVDDPRSLQPLRRSAADVTAEWTQALETVLEHFGTGSEELILTAQQHGAALNAMAAAIVAAMRRDIEAVFAPGPEEQRLRDSAEQRAAFFPFFEAPPSRRERRAEERERRRAAARRGVAELDAAAQAQMAELERQAEMQQQQQHGQRTSGRNAAAAGTAATATAATAPPTSPGAGKANSKSQAATLQKQQETLQAQTQAEREKLLAVAEAPTSADDEDNSDATADHAQHDVYTKYEFVRLLVFEAEQCEREIRTESKWFADFLALHLLRQFEVASDAVHRNGFYAVCTEATALLQSIVQSICGHVRGAVLWQEESQRDFRDNLTQLERAYQLTEERLSTAGTVTEAAQLCEQAAGLLRRIEAEYTGNCGRCEGHLRAFAASTLPQLLDREAAALFAALSVKAVDLQSMRDDAAAASRREKEKAAAGKDGGAAGKNRGSPTRRAANNNTPTRRGTSTNNINDDSNKKNGGAAGQQQQQQQDDVVAAFLAKHTVLQSMRGGTYVVTAPAEGVMELGGSLAEFLLRQQVEEAARKEAAAAANGGGAAGGGAGALSKRPGSRGTAPTANAPPAAAAASTTAAVAAGSKTKMTKQQKEELERLQAEEAARLERERAAKRLLPHEERFLNFLTREFSGVFTPGCLVAPSALPTYVGLLRSMALDWYEEYRATSLAVSARFAEVTTARLSLETHDCIRRHARRPVTLQSQVFEVRVRELQDAADARADWFQRLMHRAQRAAETAVRGIADTETVVAAATAGLEDLREEVCDAATVAAVDAQSRALQALLAEHGAHMKGAVDGVVARCEEQLRAVCGEVAYFEQEKLKTLEEGGGLTAAEKKVCEAAIAGVNEAAAAARAEVQQAAAACMAQSAAKAAAWRAEFETLLAVHRRELCFLREIGDALAKTRGTVSVMLSQSGAAQQRLGSAVERLELFASGGNDGGAGQVPERTEAMGQLRAVNDFCKLSFAVGSGSNIAASSSSLPSSSTAAQQKKATKRSSSSSASTTAAATTAAAAPEESKNGGGGGGDEEAEELPAMERIRSALLQHRVAREKALLQGSRVAKLAELVTALRTMLVERGLSLGCLAGLPEWVSNWLVLSAAASPADSANAVAAAPVAAASAAAGEWISLEYAKNYIEASSPDAAAVAAAAAAAAASGGNRTSGRGRVASPTAAGGKQGGRNANNNNGSSGNDDGGSTVPPMRSSTVRLEWQAQRLLDKTEREIARLVAAHFKPPQTAEQIAAASTLQGGRGGAGGGAAGAAGRKAQQAAAAAALAAAQQEQEAGQQQQQQQQLQLPPVTAVSRSAQYGADAAAIKDKVAKLLLDQLGRVTDHVSQHTTEYRILVRKMQVAVHGAAEELFAVLLHHQIATINEGVRIILSDFEAAYRRLQAEQRAIQQQLRAPLAAPSHAREWRALCGREERRRAAAKREIECVARHFATEMVQSGRVANARVVQALAAFFSVTRSFVLIRHLDGADSLVPETGQHRGLRRLLRLKLREDVSGPRVVDDADNGKEDDGKNNKNKKGAAGGAAGAAAGNKSGGNTAAAAAASMSKRPRAAGASASADAAAGDSSTNGEAPDPLPLPNVAPPLAPPILLAGVTAGRTVIPESSPDIAVAIQRRALAEAAAAIAASAPAAAGGGGNSNSNTKAAAASSKKEDAAALAAQQAAAAAVAAQKIVPMGDTPSGILLNLCVPAAPAPWMDEASQAIFQRIARLAAQSAADAEAAATLAASTAAGKPNLAAGPAGGAGAAGGARPAPAAGKQDRDAAVQQQLAQQQQAQQLAAQFFDPAVPFQSATFQVPGGNNSDSRIFPVAYSAAQLSIDRLDGVLSEAAQALYSKLQQLEELESRWAVAWSSAAESLGAAKNATTAAAAKASTVAAPPTPAAAGRAPMAPMRA